MFGTEWYAVGQQFHLQIPLLLAAQLAGAALGNALSVQNIAMVQAVLNEKGLERSIIKKIWKPVLLFFVFICLTAVFLSLLNKI
jgi:L-lactate permease